ncbi:MAG: LysR family transcriptional regulator [Pseudomonadota bacterium]
MDIALVRTFLEVAAMGSFVNASERLFITQSAVSLRVQRLEDALGKTLFTRSKAGAELTPAGRAFERYALSLVKIWEEARQQVGVPDGFARSLTIGAQYSLWPRFGFLWIDALQARMPDLHIRGELGMPDRVMRFLLEGVVQVGLMYSPQLRPGLTAERVLDEELVLAASEPMDMEAASDRYVFVDWGPEFVHAHALELPQLMNPGLTLSLGAMATDFVLAGRRAAYLPARFIKRHLDEQRLHLVPDAPKFPYPIWAIWRDDLDDSVRSAAQATLEQVRNKVMQEQDAVLTELGELSEDAEIAVLGETMSHSGG